MAPLKFEDEVKNKLSQREIQPSSSNWEELSKRLDKEEASVNVFKNRRFYGIVAAFIGIIVMTFFYSKNNIQTVENEIVSVKNDKTELENVKVPVVKKEDFINERNTTYIEDVNKITTVKIKKKAVRRRTVAKKVIPIDSKTSNQEDAIVQVDSLEKDLLVSKITKVAAQIFEMQKNKTIVTDDEINELLLKAQREIQTQRYIQSDKIDAASLLLDVETELDESFKERVFEVLKTSFKKMKTAVAEKDY